MCTNRTKLTLCLLAVAALFAVAAPASAQIFPGGGVRLPQLPGPDLRMPRLPRVPRPDVRMPQLPPPFRNTPFDPKTWEIPSNERPRFFGEQPPARLGSSVFRTRVGTFEALGGGRWVERGDRGETNHFEQTTQTGTYYELYDRGRNLYVRLYANRGVAFDPASQQWREWPGSQGHWVR